MTCECGHLFFNHAFSAGKKYLLFQSDNKSPCVDCNCPEFTPEDKLCKCNHPESGHLNGVCEWTVGVHEVDYCPCVKFEGDGVI